MAWCGCSRKGQPCRASSGGGTAGWSVSTSTPYTPWRRRSSKALQPFSKGVYGWVFCAKTWQLGAIPKHPEAHLWPSEVVTLGLLHALKGVGNRPFYRWLTRDYRALFPRLPERTRLFRLLKTHQNWTQVFLAAPTVLGVIDTYGIELIHPMRAGRSPQQIGRKGV